MSDKQPIRFYNLDVLRFVAASMVVFAHAYEAWYDWFVDPFVQDGGHIASLSNDPISIWVRNMGLGVDVFFLISGFLITYLLLLEKQHNGTIDIIKFYIRRALRIWPLYFLLIGLGYLIVTFFHLSPTPNYLMNLLFLNNFEVIQTDHGIYPFTHFWSICIEEHFYIVWPILLAFIPTKKLPLTFALLIISSILFRSYVAYQGWSWQYLYLHTVSRADVMVIGGLLAYMHYIKPLVISISKPIRLMIYSIFISSLFMFSYSNWDTVLSAAFLKYYYTAFFVFWFVNYLFNPTAFFNFKTKTIWHYLGKISFGIYMLSNMLIPFIAVFQKKIDRLFSSNNIEHNIVFFILLNFIVTIIISAMSYELFEKFFLRLKSRFEIIRTAR